MGATCSCCEQDAHSAHAEPAPSPSSTFSASSSPVAIAAVAANKRRPNRDGAAVSGGSESSNASGGNSGTLQPDVENLANNRMQSIEGGERQPLLFDRHGGESSTARNSSNISTAERIAVGARSVAAIRPKRETTSTALSPSGSDSAYSSGMVSAISGTTADKDSARSNGPPSPAAQPRLWRTQSDTAMRSYALLDDSDVTIAGVAAVADTSVTGPRLVRQDGGMVLETVVFLRKAQRGRLVRTAGAESEFPTSGVARLHARLSVLHARFVNRYVFVPSSLRDARLLSFSADAKHDGDALVESHHGSPLVLGRGAFGTVRLALEHPISHPMIGRLEGLATSSRGGSTVFFDSDSAGEDGVESVTTRDSDSWIPSVAECRCSYLRLRAVKVCSRSALRRKRRGGNLVFQSSDSDTTDRSGTSVVVASSWAGFYKGDYRRQSATQAREHESTTGLLSRSASHSRVQDARGTTFQQSRTALDDVFAEVAVMNFLQKHSCFETIAALDQSAIVQLEDSNGGHDNVGKLIEVIDDPSLDKIFLVFEFCDLGSLDRYVPRWDAGSASTRHTNIIIPVAGYLSSDVAQVVLRQLAAAVTFCHSLGVIHCDVKPENILIQSCDSSPDNISGEVDLKNILARGGFESLRSKFPTNGSLLRLPGRFVVKLSDFGSAVILEPASTHNTSQATAFGNPYVSSAENDARFLSRTRGTVALTIPPELTRADSTAILPAAVDAWGIGVTLYWMLVGRPPFWPQISEAAGSVTSYESEETIFDAINAQDCIGPLRGYPEIVPAEATDLLQKLLDKDHHHRITPSDALQHPWLCEA